MTPLNGEIRGLLDQAIPSGITALEEASSNLELVAAFCEQTYSQAPDKQQAFNETKKLTLQSLAGVAYHINTLSKSLLRSLDLEDEKLAISGMDISLLSQQVAIQREKAARREIGRLTVNKNVCRSNKITYPVIEERTPKYQRSAIDYSLLDEIGHGRKLSEGTHRMGGVFHLNRKGSLNASDHSSVPNTHGGSVEKLPGYGTRTLGVYSTLTRSQGGHHLSHVNSNNSNHASQQYRVPQPIPSTLHMRSNGNGSYTHMPDSRYSTMTTNMATAYARGYNLVSQAVADKHHHHPGQDSSLDMTVADGLPPPPNPPAFSARADSTIHYEAPHPDDPLPPPPSAQARAQPESSLLQTVAVMDQGGDWIPRHYIEKARVIYAYEASRPDELSLCENDIVYVLRKNADGWFECVTNGVTGLFPGNYTQPMGR